MDLKKYNIIIELYKNKKIDREEFESSVVNITEELSSPLKEFFRINCYLYNYYYVPKDKRTYLITNSLPILESDIISLDDKNKIKCALVNTYMSIYNYEMSETYAKDLLNEFSSDIKVLRELANYYTKTRRYDLADNLFKTIIKLNGEELIKFEFESYQKILNGSRSPYLPALPENKDIYIAFMKTLGIKVENTSNRIVKVSAHEKQPEKISIEAYPKPVEHIKPDFDSFVAFDVETTGIDHSKDSIIEIAAIKVVNGKIVEEKEFLFQRLVHPYKKSISQNVEKLTGITNEMVKESKRIWEAFPEFAEFIGDNILLGYNCMTFDSKFLVRAGRLSNLIIFNEYFDVMHLAQKLKKELNSDNMTLVQVGKALGIENPQAHRALADAITTAKVYLKLLELL